MTAVQSAFYQRLILQLIFFLFFSALTRHEDFTHTGMLIIAITKTKSPVLLYRLIATILQGVNVPRDIRHDD